MALKDDLATPPAPARTGSRSRIDVWRDALDDADRKAFDAAVRNPAWQASALADVVIGAGLDISEQAFRVWRRRELRERL